jgi:hypothetical protein
MPRVFNIGAMKMSEAKFTPGPWVAVNRGTKHEPMMSVMAARIAGQKPRHEVAICATGDSPQEMEDANAHLIAAAPDLYQALKTLLFNCRHGNGLEAQYQALDKAESALAKAECRS